MKIARYYEKGELFYVELWYLKTLLGKFECDSEGIVKLRVFCDYILKGEAQ